MLLRGLGHTRGSRTLSCGERDRWKGKARVEAEREERSSSRRKRTDDNDDDDDDGCELSVSRSLLLPQQKLLLISERANEATL